jgi:hypothetical protein
MGAVGVSVVTGTANSEERSLVKGSGNGLVGVVLAAGVVNSGKAGA